MDTMPKRSEFVSALNECKGETNIAYIAAAKVDEILDLVGAHWEEEGPSPSPRAEKSAEEILSRVYREPFTSNRVNFLARELDYWYGMGRSEVSLEPVGDGDDVTVRSSPAPSPPERPLVLESVEENEYDNAGRIIRRTVYRPHRNTARG